LSRFRDARAEEAEGAETDFNAEGAETAEFSRFF